MDGTDNTDRGWLSVLPSTVNEAVLRSQEWRDYLFLSYGVDTPDLPDHCDGCGAAFDILLAIEYNKGGLITARHSELCDGVSDLSGRAFNPAYVRDNHKIFTCRSVREGNQRKIIREG